MYCDFCLKVNISLKNLFAQIIKEEGKVVYRTDTITIVKLGCIFDKSGKLLSNAEIINLYKTHGVNILKLFDGLYNLVVVDTKLEKAFIFHDHISGDSHIYYTFDGENIFISSSIKNIINSMPDIEWYLDEESIEEFIDKGYLTENKTLIYDIFKSSNKKYTEFNLKNGFVADRSDTLIEFDSKDNITVPKYDRIFDDAVLKCLKGKYAIGLANDYDSIYTIHHARINEPKRKPIKVYSAFSNSENKEKIANEICKSFNNTQCNVAEIGKDVLDYLPLIVYITEGTAFDCNAFKDFEIARILKRDSISSFISSEGVNGIYNHYFYSEFDKNYDIVKKKIPFVPNVFGKNKNSKEINSYSSDKLVNVTVAQSGMIFNYFDVRYFNAYMFKKYLQTAYKKVRPDNSRYFHQNAIKENVSSDALRYATKSMPKVDVLSLFKGNIDAKVIAHIASKSYFFKKYSRKYTDSRDKANHCLRIIYLELFQTIFIGRNSKKMLKSKKFNYSLKAFFPKYFKKEN